MNLGSSSSNSVSTIRPSRDGSIGRAAGNGISTAGAQGTRRGRDSITLNTSESENTGGNNGWDSTMSVNIISAATAQALQARLAEAEEKHKINWNEKDTTAAERDGLAKDLDWVRGWRDNEVSARK
ncbi:hypothetical protein EDD21DRAFT_409661 [Dissophora ornata]|nr:hypothetical protein EDD21DRAFT_409661 [Dissophora ornata]